MKVTDIIFGNPVTPDATARTGKLEGKLITVGREEGNVNPPGALADTEARMKVQWTVGNNPQKQVSRKVVGNAHFIAIHLDEKDD